MRSATWITVAVIAIVVVIGLMSIDWTPGPDASGPQVGEVPPVGGQIEGEPIPGADDDAVGPDTGSTAEDTVIVDDTEGVTVPAD